MSMRIAITVDALALDAHGPADVTGVLEAVEAVERALTELGHESYRVPLGDAPRTALALLFSSPPDLVFNLCESVQGSGEGEARLIGALELAGIPVTGASAELVTVARRKDWVGALLADRGVVVPPSVLLARGDPPPADWTSFPCIAKPAAADGSLGIAQHSVAADPADLDMVVNRMRAHSPLLLQPLLTGRELNVAMVGDRLLPVAEIEYVGVPAGAWPIVDYAAKWETGSAADLMTVPRCPAAIPPAVAAAASALGQAAWRAVGGCGFGRVDLREDATGTLHVLEVNPNPDLAPSAGLARMAAAAGWSYRELVERIIAEAIERTRPARPAPRAPLEQSQTELSIGALPQSARPDVERILECTGMFRADEIQVALEVIDAYFANPDQDYTALGAFTRAGELVGYSCHGPTPCTLGTCDLYWIAVDPAAQRAGVGSALLQEVERRLAQEDARLLLIETSSQPRYQPTRGFYERHGYHEVARVPEFYAPGDDRVIFAKRIHPVRRG